MTTIRDVAKRCGLSAMTVSSVLNNRPGSAAPETRDRVLRAVEEMGYRPNAVARSFRQQRMNTLGVVMSRDEKVSLTADRYFGPVLDGILEVSSKNHQKLLVIAEESWETVQENLLTYTDGYCDGLIFILPIMPTEVIAPLLKRKTPFVLIGESRPEEWLSVVDMDNLQAGTDAVDYLIQSGHRRIAFFKGDDLLLSSHQREAGYRQSLTAAGIPVDERLIFPGGYQIESGYERMCFLLSRRQELKPTAVFCADDFIAHGALQALTEQGLRVPEDMSLIGINDDKEVSLLKPGLTTFRQPLNELGKRAVEMVLNQINQGSHDGIKELLPGELIVRGSVSLPATVFKKF
ncbi:MAG: LacI family DNA-binding transcriptional regulator [Janthinobacterium lividum]